MKQARIISARFETETEEEEDFAMPYYGGPARWRRRRMVRVTLELLVPEGEADAYESGRSIGLLPRGSQ